MKVILLQDVAKIGRRSEVVEVPDGYALNQLIPKRMAEPATAANLKRVERQSANAEANQAAGQERYEAAAKRLAEKTLEITTEANEQGHLFKAVSESDIVAAARVAGVEIEASLVAIDAPIKELGKHTLKLVRGEAVSDFTIDVIKK